MNKYCIYNSDQSKTKFIFVEFAESEEDGRTQIWAYFAATVFQENFKTNKIISLHLFKGTDNVSGKLVLTVNLSVTNSKF